MDFRRRRQRKRTQKKKKQSRKTRRKRTQKFSKPSNMLLNVSPISSPGPNSPSFSLSPNTPPPNTPTTKRAKELGKLYPNTRTMVQRSTSYDSNNGLSTENFYREFQRLFPEGNGPRYH